ncbi:hypothetical protein Plhal304r1_c012g0046761 [Plasmopara halstedii]
MLFQKLGSGSWDKCNLHKRKCTKILVAVFYNEARCSLFAQEVSSYAGDQGI